MFRFITLTVFTALMVLPVSQGFSQERESISLELGNHYSLYKQCSGRPFQGIQVHWRGLVDNRPEKALGTVVKKNGKDPIEVFSAPPLRDIYVGYLKDLLQRCGMKFLPVPSPEVYELTVYIEKFRAHEEKGIFMGKGQAISRLSLEAKLPQKKITAQVGYEIEFNQGRKSGIKRMKKILTELFRETLLQVVASPQLQDLRGE